MRQAYSFSGSSTDVLLLTVRSDDLLAGPVIALRDADTTETLSLSSARLGGIRYRILSGEANYLLEVTGNGASTAQAFSVCLALESDAVMCAESASIATTTANVTQEVVVVPTSVVAPTVAAAAINPAGACQVASAGGQSINVRGGAGTSFGVVTQLAPNAVALVIGRLGDNSWFQVNVNGGIGWVSAGVVTLGGNCSGVSVIALPTAPVVLSTTEPPVTAPTNTPPNTPVPAIATPVPVYTPRLNTQALSDNPLGDFTVVGVFGTTVTGGGSVDATYLGGGCFGYVSAQPDLSLNLINEVPLMYIVFDKNSFQGVYSTLIIQDPDGNFHCADDDFGAYSAALNFSGPVRGTYNIWVGVYAAGIPIEGTLYIADS